MIVIEDGLISEGINVEEKSCQSTDDVISDASTAGPIVPGNILLSSVNVRL